MTEIKENINNLDIRVKESVNFIKNNYNFLTKLSITFDKLMEKVKLHNGYIITSVNFWNNLISIPHDKYNFDPINKYEMLITGILGSIESCDILTYFFEDIKYKRTILLKDNEVYLSDGNIIYRIKENNPNEDNNI